MDYVGLGYGTIKVLVSLVIGFSILGIIQFLFNKYDRN